MRWGEPAYLRLGSREIARAEIVRLDEERCLHIEHFRPLNISAAHAIAVRKLAMLEIIWQALSMGNAVRCVSLVLYYQAQGEDEGIRQAADRASFLRSFGVSEIKVLPDFAHSMTGQFIVQGVWERTPKALAMLEERLGRERDVYAEFIASRSLRRLVRQGLRQAAERLRLP